MRSRPNPSTTSPRFSPSTCHRSAKRPRKISPTTSPPAAGLIVFPGPAVDAKNYNDLLLDRLKILPARLNTPRGDADQQEKFFPIQPDHFRHPIAELWNDPANGSPASIHVYKTFDLSPDPAARPVLYFADGRPLVVERPVGRGRCALFGTTADTAWTDLPDHGGIFVPLIYRTLSSILTRGDEPLNVHIDQPLVYPLPIETLGRPILITDPSGKKSKGIVQLENDIATARFTDTPLAGLYTVDVTGQKRLSFAATGRPQLNPACRC